MWAQTVVDAPESYRAWIAFGTLLYLTTSQERGIQAYHLGLELYDKSAGPMLQLAEWYRKRDDCPNAIPLYTKALTMVEYAPALASLTACLAWEGHYRTAQQMALRGMRTGYFGGLFHVWFRTALDAERAGAPVHTAKFPKGHDYLFAQEAPTAPGLAPGAKLVP
jgi:hypothetical protein